LTSAILYRPSQRDDGGAGASWPGDLAAALLPAFGGGKETFPGATWRAFAPVRNFLNVAFLGMANQSCGGKKRLRTKKDF
jgi:hypothetical protein